MASAPPALVALARSLPRAADLAFEARRHAARCSEQLQRAATSLQHLRDLVSERAAPADLDHGRLLDVDAHLMVLEQKSRVYAAICATIEAFHDALGLARTALDRLGSSSTSLMRALRTQPPSTSAEDCRRVVNDLVVEYTSHADRYSDLEAALGDALPGDLHRPRAAFANNAKATSCMTTEKTTSAVRDRS